MLFRLNSNKFADRDKAGTHNSPCSTSLFFMREMDTCNKLKDGSPSVLVEVQDPVLASRLISMGIFPGTIIRLIRSTLGGNTYFIQAGDHYFAMRKREVNALLVSPVNEQ